MIVVFNSPSICPIRSSSPAASSLTYWSWYLREVAAMAAFRGGRKAQTSPTFWQGIGSTCCATGGVPLLSVQDTVASSLTYWSWYLREVAAMAAFRGGRKAQTSRKYHDQYVK